MIYIFCLVLGSFCLYFYQQVQHLKNKLKSNFDMLAVIVNFVEPNRELKPYEVRSIQQYQLDMEEIKKELTRVEGIALRSLELVGTIIRNSKEHPVSSEAINQFILEEGLLKDE